MIIRAKAPLRMSFGGGGTDVAPYPEEHGGVVLSATIDKYAYASVVPRGDTVLAVQSLDYDISTRYRLDERLRYDGELDLVKAAVRKMGINQGLHLFLHNDAPPGSGLGSSSSVVVALVAALSHLVRMQLTDYEIAELAYDIERVELGIKGGRQDQYAAAFGGFNFMEFGCAGTIVSPLRIRPEITRELEYHMLLCFTGKVRPSVNILDHQIGAYVRKEKSVVDALHELKRLAVETRNALLRGRLMEFGLLLDESWRVKKLLAEQITDPAIDHLYEAARAAGAIGGKLLGAGGGGYMMLFVPFHQKHVVAAAVEGGGGQVVPFGFEPSGVVSWEVDNYLDIEALDRDPHAALSDARVMKNARGRVV